MINSTIEAILRQLLSFLLLSGLFISCTEPSNPNDQKKSAVVSPAEPAGVPKKEINIDRFKANLSTEIGKEVLSILQDRNDNYWFGTNGGVYRYDGKNLIVFRIRDGLYQNQVQEIQEDNSGTIWFTTGGYGVNCFKSDTIITFKVKENTPLKSTPEKNWKTEPGDLWFCAGGGAFRYCKDSFAYLPFPKPGMDLKYLPHPPYQASAYGVYASMKDRSGNLWFGTQAMGVCRYDGKSFTWFTEHGLRGPAVIALFEDRNGTIWFGNNGNGLFCFDGKTVRNLTEDRGLSNHEFIKSGKQGPGTLARVWAINEDDRGNLWIGTADAGVWQYDGRNLVNYTIKNGLPGSGIETIYKDKKGTLWFGTAGDGVYTLNGLYFTKFTPGAQRL
jgi:ligand-binding sensor domain-containing protein